MEPKAYIYSRYSSAKQSKGTTLTRQLEECLEFAATLGVPVDTSLHFKGDHGLSGFTGMNRIKGALGAFIASVDRGDIARGSFLLVDSMDRVSRENETQVLNMLTGLSLKGIRICNVSERHVLPETPDMVDWIRLLAHASRAHHESVEKSRKVSKAHNISKSRAREEGRVWHRTGPRWLTATQVGMGRDKQITFHKVPEKVAAVRRIFDMIESGMGTTAIAVRFNNEQPPVPGPRGGTWHHSAVLEVAKNRACIGEYQPRFAKDGDRASRRPVDGEVITNYYPAVVEPDQFHRVQAIIKSRGTSRTRKATKSFNNLFLGMARCFECGGRMGMHVAGAKARWKRTDVLRCVDAIRGMCSATAPNRKRFAYEPLERAVLTHVSEFVIPEQRRDNRAADALALAVAECDDLRRKIENLLDLAEGGDPDVRARLTKRRGELRAKEAHLRDLREQYEQGGATPPMASRQEALQRLVRQMATAEGEGLYRLRVAVNEALSGVIDWMDFDPDGSVRLILQGATIAYQFRMDRGLSGQVERLVIPQAIAAE